MAGHRQRERSGALPPIGVPTTSCRDSSVAGTRHEVDAATFAEYDPACARRPCEIVIVEGRTATVLAVVTFPATIPLRFEGAATAIVHPSGDQKRSVERPLSLLIRLIMAALRCRMNVEKRR